MQRLENTLGRAICGRPLRLLLYARAIRSVGKLPALWHSIMLGRGHEMHGDRSISAPSLFRASLVFVATAALVSWGVKAPAQQPPCGPHAAAGEPSVRIRERLSRLDPVALADWLVAQPHRPLPEDRPSRPRTEPARPQISVFRLGANRTA